MTRRLYLYVLIAACAIMLSSCGTHKHTAYYDHKTKLIGTELDGSYTVVAWGRARNAVDAFHQAQKQAVYDVIFNGAEAQTTNLRNILPMLLEVNAKDKYQDYFNAFFADKGEYTKYCSKKDRRWWTSEFYRSDRQTVCKTTVVVYSSKLKEKLIQDKIIQEH